MKDASVEQVLAKLREELGTGSFDVVDFWDADRFAMRVRKKDNAGRLVYFSSWNQPPGTVAFELEKTPSGSNVGRTVRSGTATVAALVDVVRTFLCVSQAEAK